MDNVERQSHDLHFSGMDCGKRHRNAAKKDRPASQTAFQQMKLDAIRALRHAPFMGWAHRQ